MFRSVEKYRLEVAAARQMRPTIQAGTETTDRFGRAHPGGHCAGRRALRGTAGDLTRTVSA
ncbi:hypothetical protein ACWEN6_18705 [Sphaerisporangium sp. NPDC004334]